MQGECRALKERLDALLLLEEFKDFDELDWAPVAAEIAQLEDERRRLESASDVLQQLNDQFREANQALTGLGIALQSARDKRSRVEQRRSDAETLRQDVSTHLVDAPFDPSLTARLEAMRVEALGDHQLSDDSEFEHCSDSGGKSGGQKEKLAYTMLAASLAYQFGLKWGEVNHRVHGPQRLPQSLWVDTLDDAFALIGKRADAARFDRLLTLTQAKIPERIHHGERDQLSGLSSGTGFHRDLRCRLRLGRACESRVAGGLFHPLLGRH
ncbi:MAG: DUF3322 domain-containing protein [Methylococcales bacterium]